MSPTWAKSPAARGQTLVFYPTLESMIPEDHTVRFLEDLLLSLDWSEWEQEYHGERGQPAIHPRELAGLILYGLMTGLRSSRELEAACGNRLDVMWLLHRRRVDHSTIARFRVNHTEQLKALSRQVCRLAKGLSWITLETVATDGTRILADTSRHHTASAAELERWVAEAAVQFDQGLEQMKAADARDDARWGEDGSPQKLPALLAKIHDRQAVLTAALAAVHEVEAERDRRGEAREDKPVKVPISDSEARILPNKEGGYAPNYTPVITVDAAFGLIVDEDVVNTTAEAPVQRAAVARLEATFGERPQTMMADALYGEAATLETMAKAGIELLTPIKDAAMAASAPTYRPDPRTPLSAEQIATLPVAGKAKRFTRQAFQFDEATDCFYCPVGQPLVYKWTRTRHQKHSEVKVRTYCGAAETCAGCPWRTRCVAPRQSYRRIECSDTVVHAIRLAAKMQQAEVKERYRQRFALDEQVFGHLKHNLGIRRFLHRGLAKVRTEWTWICLGYNLKKMINLNMLGDKCVQNPNQAA